MVIIQNRAKKGAIFMFFIALFLNLKVVLNSVEQTAEQCSLNTQEECSDSKSHTQLYDEASNKIYEDIRNALENFETSTAKSSSNDCELFQDVISRDLEFYVKSGVTKSNIDAAASQYGTRYQIRNHRLFRDTNCMFPARCTGIEHFLLRLLPQLNDTELIINTRDYPQLTKYHANKGPVFSFSKTSEYIDIMYPAWTFWAGGPAISMHPTGIGRWDILRENLSKTSNKIPWRKKQSIGFFRGSRTSDERDSIVLLSRRKPELVDAKYTKNQAWKSPKDTLNSEPAKEVPFEDHCRYKYLFNFRGVAASFRFKHLFLCKSLVFHVGSEWNEFFYFALKPWVHYVPLKSYPKEEDIENILLFFQKNDKLAQKIAEKGFNFIYKNLRMKDVECYWKTLLRRYTALLKFKVEPNKELIEIKAKN